MDSAVAVQNDQVVVRPTPPPPESVNRKIDETLDSAKVFFLDPDFIFLFMIAVVTDAMDIFLHPTGFGLAITIPIDILVFFIMLAWSFARGTRVENAKEEARALLEQYIDAAEGKAVKRAKRLRLATRIARTKRGKRILIRVLRRVGLAAVASLVPFLGMIPWWTILMILALRERVTLEDSNN